VKDIFGDTGDGEVHINIISAIKKAPKMEIEDT